MIGIAITGTEQAARRLVQTRKRIRAEIKVALRQSVELVAASVRQRMFPARRQNVQDATTKKTLSGRRMVKQQVGDSEGWVRVGAYLVNARGRIIRAALEALGVSVARKGLWVHKKGGKSSKQGYDSRDGLEFRSFSKYPKLREWAIRNGQFDRHTIRMDRRANTKLSLAPALEANRAAIRNSMAAAVARGVSGS